MDHDRVQLNALDYDPDIDGPQPPRRHVNTAVVSVQDHFAPSESEILDVTESLAEDYTTEESTNSIHHSSEVSNGYEDLPSDIQINTTTAHRTTTEYNADSDKIPELEEDWDNGQFADADYEEETPVNQLQYSSPDPDYYSLSTRRSQKPPCDPNGYYPPPPIKQTCSTGTHEVEGKQLYYMGTDFFW